MIHLESFQKLIKTIQFHKEMQISTLKLKLHRKLKILASMQGQHYNNKIAHMPSNLNMERSPIRIGEIPGKRFWKINL